MAFKLYSTDDGHVPAWEYLPVSSIKPEVGMGLAADEGTGLLKASAIPTHICMRTEDAAVAEGTLIPCVVINDNQVWQNGFYNNSPNAKVGMKCDVSATGLWVNGTATVNGNFEINYLSGTTMDSTVRGRFVK